MGLGIVSVLSIGAHSAFGQCTCWPPHRTLQEDFQRADVVFIGKVVEMQTNTMEQGDSSETVVKVEVKKTWKEDLERFVIVKDFSEKGVTHGIELNEEWLFYAHKLTDQGNDFLAWGCCSRTKLLSKAEEDLKQFRKMKAGPKKIL